MEIDGLYGQGVERTVERVDSELRDLRDRARLWRSCATSQNNFSMRALLNDEVDRGTDCVLQILLAISHWTTLKEKQRSSWPP